MTTLLEDKGVQLPFRLPPVTLEEFAEFCRRNPDLQAERTAKGELVIMAPAEAYGDSRNIQITTELEIWNRLHSSPGIVFGQSAGFTLPNTAVRSPDAAWISHDRWDALTQSQMAGFAAVCPEFVVELLSPSDSLRATQDKMEEYLANGVSLGWLIDRKRRQVYIYRPGRNVEVLDDPAEVSAAPELPGFVLPMHLVFS